ncbi:unnamed protein product [Periconia digitata]|uniref:Uncharacterized protein n=1 Tax=Periconia digitata TaxID=1303443 RepID=A0A9W4U5H9_9PLEO|nr:unnamed protein product [Periconia digitata]
MALFTRQPFAEIGSPRLQALHSAKNRQNAISSSSATFTPFKPTSPSSTGKRRASDIFDDSADSENVDPSSFNSPAKKSKICDAGYVKPARFSLMSSPVNKAGPTSSSPVASVRKALSSPNTAHSTPINHSRGSPKHKRVGLLSKRRTSGSPFRRVDPPSFSTQSSPALPFSIDAALSGTIPNYTPKSTQATPITTPSHTPVVDESMPKSWFFEIHEDTQEQEAANMMEHSAAVLDISSDDDFETKQLNEDRGKENVPPPEFMPAQANTQQQADGAMEAVDRDVPAEQHVKLPRLRKIAQDAMDEDRKPLGDLPATEFYGEGCDATSYITVEAGLEKPSGLSKEFDFNCPTPEKNEDKSTALPMTASASVEVAPHTEEGIEIYNDESAVAPQEAVAPTETILPSEPQHVITEAL